MTRTMPFIAALGAALSMLSAPSIAAADMSPLGVWIDHSGRGAVEIKSCGTALCGYVVAVKNDRDTKGCGKQIIGGAKAASNNLWEGGWIYSPERRKTYDVELKPLNDGTLRVVGFAGIKMFSRTMIWKPAPADLKRCDSSEEIAAVTPAPKTSAATKATKAPTSEPVTATPPLPAPKPAETATTEPAPKAATDAATTPSAPAEITEPSAAAPATANDDSSDVAAAESAEDNGPPTAREKGLDLGGLNLEKILTKTADGKCKIDLPWVKVTVDCNAD